MLLASTLEEEMFGNQAKLLNFRTCVTTALQSGVPQTMRRQLNHLLQPPYILEDIAAVNIAIRRVIWGQPERPLVGLDWLSGWVRRSEAVLRRNEPQLLSLDLSVLRWVMLQTSARLLPESEPGSSRMRPRLNELPQQEQARVRQLVSNNLLMRWTNLDNTYLQLTWFGLWVYVKKMLGE